MQRAASAAAARLAALQHTRCCNSTNPRALQQRPICEGHAAPCPYQTQTACRLPPDVRVDDLELAHHMPIMFFRPATPQGSPFLRWVPSPQHPPSRHAKARCAPKTQEACTTLAAVGSRLFSQAMLLPRTHTTTRQQPPGPSCAPCMLSGPRMARGGVRRLLLRPGASTRKAATAVERMAADGSLAGQGYSWRERGTTVYEADVGAGAAAPAPRCACLCLCSGARVAGPALPCPALPACTPGAHRHTEGWNACPALQVKPLARFMCDSGLSGGSWLHLPPAAAGAATAASGSYAVSTATPAAAAGMYSPDSSRAASRASSAVAGPGSTGGGGRSGPGGGGATGLGYSHVPAQQRISSCHSEVFAHWRALQPLTPDATQLTDAAWAPEAFRWLDQPQQEAAQEAAGSDGDSAALLQALAAARQGAIAPLRVCTLDVLVAPPAEGAPRCVLPVSGACGDGGGGGGFWVLPARVARGRCHVPATPCAPPPPCRSADATRDPIICITCTLSRHGVAGQAAGPPASGAAAGGTQRVAFLLAGPQASQHLGSRLQAGDEPSCRLVHRPPIA